MPKVVPENEKVSFNVKDFPKIYNRQIDGFAGFNGLTKSQALTLIIVKGLPIIQNMSEEEIEVLKSQILGK